MAELRVYLEYDLAANCGTASAGATMVSTEFFRREYTLQPPAQDAQAAQTARVQARLRNAGATGLDPGRLER